MSYLVLARKYRPMTFVDVVGQEHVVRTLQNAIKLGRVHHAFLFTGARGVGKTTSARVLAKALNCEKGPTPDPCGECQSCKEIAAGSSPDVVEIDGASNRGIDNIRELRETVRYLPSRGRCKLYIIDEVHMLTTEAFNALLKTLEEPPEHVKFIFATTEPQKIPITILSRCQRFDFRRVSVQQLTEHVRGILKHEGVTLGAGALSAVVREAQGSVRDALSLLDQVLSYAGHEATDDQAIEALGLIDRRALFTLWDAVFAKDAAALLELVARLDARGHDLPQAAALAVEHLRDVMVMRTLESPSEAVLDRSPGELEALKAQAARVATPELHRYFRLAIETAEDTARSTLPRVSFELGLLRLLEVEPAQSVATLIERLEAMAGGASAGRNVVSAQASSAPPAPRSAPTPVRASPKPVAMGDEGSEVSRSQSMAAPAPTTGPGTAWERFVARVQSAHPALGSVLEHGKPVAFGPQGVEIGYVPGTFYWERAREAETRAKLEQTLKEQFGQDVRFGVVALEANAAAEAQSIAESEDARRKQRRDKIKSDALEHPAVKSAVTILGGEVKEVNPLESAPATPAER